MAAKLPRSRVIGWSLATSVDRLVAAAARSVSVTSMTAPLIARRGAALCVRQKCDRSLACGLLLMFRVQMHHAMYILVNDLLVHGVPKILWSIKSSPQPFCGPHDAALVVLTRRLPGSRQSYRLHSHCPHSRTDCSTPPCVRRPPASASSPVNGDRPLPPAAGRRPFALQQRMRLHKGPHSHRPSLANPYQRGSHRPQLLARHHPLSTRPFCGLPSAPRPSQASLKGQQQQQQQLAAPSPAKPRGGVMTS